MGYNVSVISPYNEETENLLKKYSIPVRNIDFSRSGLNPFKEIKTLLDFYKHFSNGNCDIIISSTLKPVLYSSIISLLFREKRFINIITGFGILRGPGGLKTFFLLMVISIFRLIQYFRPLEFIVQNLDDFQVLNKYSEFQPIKIRGSGVDTQYFRPRSGKVESTEKTILFCGRLLKQKGLLVFFDIVVMLRHEENFRFLLVGDIDPVNKGHIDKEFISARCEALGIEWLGEVTDPGEAYQNSDFLVFPSVYGEGLPRVVIEAMACGVIPIVSDIPGCTEAVDHMVNGVVCGDNSPDKFVHAIRSLSADPARAKLLSENARYAALKKFSNEVVVTQMISVVESGTV